MKKIAIALLLTIVLLCTPASALAGSFGVSPSDVELEVPSDGSATCDFTIYGLDGTVDIGLENVPLTYNPTSIDVTDGETITVTFYGDGTNNTYEGEITFLASTGETILAGIKVRLTVHVNCTTEVITPPPSGGGGGSGYPRCETDFCGATGSFYIDGGGKVLQMVTAGCKDGPLTVTIEKGTIALDKAGKPLKNLTMKEVTPAPAPPEGSNIIGLPVTLGPDGATFDPAVTFVWTYDPAGLPEGVAPEDLVLAYYDEETGKWIEIDCVVDTENNTITASVSHFSTFAIIGAVTPAPEPTPPPTTTPTPPTITPPTTTPPATTPPAPETMTPVTPPPLLPEPDSKWPLIGGIIGGLVIVGLLILFLVRRRA